VGRRTHQVTSLREELLNVWLGTESAGKAFAKVLYDFGGTILSEDLYDWRRCVMPHFGLYIGVLHASEEKHGKSQLKQQ
jgi:hypothetical protein